MVINIGSLFGRGTAFVVRSGSGLDDDPDGGRGLRARRRRHRPDRAQHDEGRADAEGHLDGDGRVHRDHGRWPRAWWRGSTARHRGRARSGAAPRTCRCIFAVAAIASIVGVLRRAVHLPRAARSPADTPAKPKRSVWRILARHGARAAATARFTLFLVVMTGFFFLYNQVYNVLPLYVKRVVEPSPAMDLYTAANPFIIVCFQLIITSTWGKMKPIRSMVVGTVIIGVAMLHQHRPIYMAGGPQALVAELAAARVRVHHPDGGAHRARRAVHLAADVRVHRRAGAEGPGRPVPRLREPAAGLRRACSGGPVGACIFNEIMAKGATTKARRPARTGAGRRTRSAGSS